MKKFEIKTERVTWNGKVYTGTLDGRLIAIDAKTGAEVWSTQTTQVGNGQFITGAPRVFNGKVIIGHGGADFGHVPTLAHGCTRLGRTGRAIPWGRVQCPDARHRRRTH